MEKEESTRAELKEKKAAIDGGATLDLSGNGAGAGAGGGGGGAAEDGGLPVPGGKKG